MNILRNILSVLDFDEMFRNMNMLRNILSVLDIEITGMGLMTIKKGNFCLLDSRVNFPYRHSVF